MVLNKLKSTSGESIAETLVAVLISAFALLMLAGTINTSSNLISNGQAKLEEYYDAGNVLADHTLDDAQNMTITVAGDGNSVSEDVSVSGYALTSEDSSIVGSRNLVAYEKAQPETSALPVGP